MSAGPVIIGYRGLNALGARIEPTPEDAAIMRRAIERVARWDLQVNGSIAGRDDQRHVHAIANAAYDMMEFHPRLRAVLEQRRGK